MKRLDKKREEIREAEEAHARAKSLLAKEFATEEKVKFFDDMHDLARSYLQEMVDEGCVSHHTTDAFESYVLRGIWGDDFYEWVYDLGE